MSFKSMTITFDPRVMLPLVAVTALVGCNLFEPSVEETKPEDAQTLVDSLVYVKAKNGLCFGVTTTSRMATSGSAAYNNHLVQVDCATVKL